MDQQQNYIISLIAVFLALGIGILIGAAMGENALITNQIAVIEELNNEIGRHKEEAETQSISVARLKKELAGWQSLEEEYLNSLLIEDQIKDVTVKIIARGSLPADLVDFLKLGGCSYQTFVFTEPDPLPPEKLNEEDEEALLLEVGPSPLKGDLLELILGEENNFSASNILYKTADNSLLEVQIEQNTSSARLNEASYGREYYMAYGELDSFCLDLLHKIGLEGKTVLRIDLPKVQTEVQKYATEREPVAWKRFILDSFFDKFKLLEFLQAVD